MSSQGLNNQELREFSFEDEDEMIEQMTEERNRGRIDNRPSISDINTSLDYNRIIHKDEEEKVIKRIRKSEKEKEKDRKTIMDMPLKDIISKTTETTANFWEDYKIKLIEVKYHYEKKNDIDFDHKATWSDFFSIHSLTFVEYMKEHDHVLYIGIFLVIISVIIYIFNITSS